MRRKNTGVKVDDRICMLLYAGDVVVMSESAEELQELLDVVVMVLKVDGGGGRWPRTLGPRRLG